MHGESRLERRFWRFWLAGLLLLALQIVLNVWLITDVSPMGISDHQAAGTAARIDAIQSAWTAAGVMRLAIGSMALDLLYIGIYSWGAYAGGFMFAESGKPALIRLGRVIMITTIGYALADYAETICQVIQAAISGGNDAMARIAATARPVKSVLFLVTFFAILTALAVRRILRRTA